MGRCERRDHSLYQQGLVTNGVIKPVVNAQTSLDQAGLLAALEGVQLPRLAHADSQMSIDVTARNPGQAIWLTEPPGLVNVKGVVGVSVRAWRRADGTLVAVSDDSTVYVPRNVAAGQSARVTLQTRTPRDAGRYVLVLDLLSESVTWFADAGGGAGTAIPVMVED